MNWSRPFYMWEPGNGWMGWPWLSFYWWFGNSVKIVRLDIGSRRIELHRMSFKSGRVKLNWHTSERPKWELQ